jgi:hypothetical protein
MPANLARGTPGRYGPPWRAHTWPQCRYCGHAGADCPETVCLACRTVQCRRPASGDCRVCLIGRLDGYWHPNPTCGYHRCDGRAVADAPRVGQVCADCLDRPTRRSAGITQTLAGVIADGLALLEQSNSPRWHRVPAYRRMVFYPYPGREASR